LAHAESLMDRGAQAVSPSSSEIASCAERLARGASIEINGLELHELEAAREMLTQGQRVYVSHLPGQTWDQTLDLCASVAGAGFDPVPHIPVRLVNDRQQLAGLLRALFDAGVREPLLLAGDCPKPKGAFSEVLEVLRSGVLQTQGFTRVSFAGHPEGHPAVSSREIRQAQIEKWRVGSGLGLQVTFVTQFFFNARPFADWACDLRSAGVRARLVAGLAGPTGITRLLRLARRCGVGPSMRALTTRPSSLFNLMTDHDPDGLLRDLAIEWHQRTGLFDGIHVFSFGGLLRTATWLRRYEPGMPRRDATSPSPR
jgi:methylenetetrahydrofolate reductase (NADPH)